MKTENHVILFTEFAFYKFELSENPSSEPLNFVPPKMNP